MFYGQGRQPLACGATAKCQLEVGTSALCQSHDLVRLQAFLQRCRPACSLLMYASVMSQAACACAQGARPAVIATRSASSVRSRAKRRGLFVDRRGAILVPAVVMGALLVGVLFYVAAVGDAISFRTQMQDAADSTSFESAVWHARGMNLVAITNILMSLALAFFAALRAAEILLFALATVTAGASIAPATNLLAQEPRVFQAVNTALTVLEGTQEAVSMGVPYIAAFNAKSLPTAAQTVSPVTLALIPPKLDRDAGQPTRRPGQGAAALPIQDDEFSTLCGKAVAFAPEQVDATLGRLHLRPRGPLKKVFDKIVKKFLRKLGGAGDGLFCRPATGQTFDVVSAKMWEPAANGNVVLQAWSFVYTTPRMYFGDRQGMEIAGQGRKVQTVPQQRSVAEAEYYFDCNKIWDKCKEDAVWAPNWTARMRRFRFPGGEMRRLGLDYPLLSGGLRGASGLPGGLGNLAGQSIISGFIGEQLRKLPLIGEITTAIGSAFSELGNAAEIDGALNTLLELDSSNDKRRVH